METTLITGASSGLGEGLAKRYAVAGDNLILMARRTERLEQVKAQCLALNPAIKVAIYPLDVSMVDEVLNTFEQAITDFNGVDRVIVNAGVGFGTPLGKGNLGPNIKTVQVNVIGAMAQIEAALAHFRPKNRGHLVLISSISALRGLPYSMNVYAATKSALASIAEGLTIELMHKNIDVSCIYPGFIATAINESVPNRPFLLDLEQGCDQLFHAIAQKPVTAYVPSWPWRFLHPIFRVLPNSILRRIF